MGFFDKVSDFTDVAGIGTQLVGLGMQSNTNNLNWQRQKEMAQNQIQWRVEDAKKAGIHPLAALGVSPASFTAVASAPDVSGLGGMISQMGQNADRAAMQAKTQQQQDQAAQDAHDIAELTKEKMRLENIGQGKTNDILNTRSLSDLARFDRELQPNASTGSTVGTKSGIPGQVPANRVGSVEYKADEVISTAPGNPSTTAGSHALWNDTRNGQFVMPVIDGNYGDSVTESAPKSYGSEIAYAIGAYNGKIPPPDRDKWTPEETRKIKSGKFEWYYYPFVGWRVEPRVSWDNFKRFLFGEFSTKTRYSDGHRTVTGHLRW